MSPMNSAGYVSVPELAKAALLDPRVLLAAPRCSKPKRFIAEVWNPGIKYYVPPLCVQLTECPFRVF